MGAGGLAGGTESACAGVGELADNLFLAQGDFFHLACHYRFLEFGVGHFLLLGLVGALHPQHHQKDGGTQPEEGVLVGYGRLWVIVRLLWLVWPPWLGHSDLPSGNNSTQ